MTNDEDEGRSPKTRQGGPPVVARVPAISAVVDPSSFISPPSALRPPPSSFRPPPSFWLFLVIWLVLLVGGRSSMLRDPGTFWHLVVGDRILASGHMIHEDPFSFTRIGHPWVADQWLAECGMAIVHGWAGWDGLLLVSATLLAAIYAWIGSRLLRGGLHWMPTVLLLALAMLAGAPQFHVRPLIATIVLLGITFGWLVDVENGRRSFNRLWWLVPLFLLWTNIHGGVLGGLATVVLCVVGWPLAAAWDRYPAGARTSRPDRAKRSLRNMMEPMLLLLVLAATLFASPYGVAVPREWLDTLRMPLPKFIAEHAPLELTDPMGWGTAALAMGYIITLIGVFPQRPRVTWLVPLVWFLLALLRLRNAPLFGVVAVIALADMLPYSRVGKWLKSRDLLRIADDESATGVASCCRAVILPAVVVLAALLLQIGGVSAPVVGRGWARLDSERWPVELLPALREINRSNADGTRIFNDLNFGGFLIYHAPRLRVFVDDRCPLYGTKFLWDCENARCEEPAQIDRWQQQYDFHYALVRTGEPLDRYLSKSAGWRLVKRCTAASLYRQE